MEEEIYVTKVIKEDDSLVMLFQRDLLDKMNFVENSVWQWVPQKDGTIILNRVGDSTLEQN
jgi:hypothetical protein